MSSKSFFLFLLVFFFSIGCGVKARPVQPADTAIDSYIQHFTDEEPKKVESLPSTSAPKK